MTIIYIAIIVVLLYLVAVMMSWLSDVHNHIQNIEHALGHLEFRAQRGEPDQTFDYKPESEE